MLLEPRQILVILLIAFASRLEEVSSQRVRSEGQWAEGPALIPSHLRSHFRENTNLAPLSEDELETLLFLLEKVRPPGTETDGRVVHERRSKRVGVGHGQPHKKAAEWTNKYWGVDKRSVHGPPPPPIPVNVVHPSGGQSEHVHEDIPKPVLVTPPKAAEKTKSKADVLKSFYKSMAMATNMKRRKRSVEDNMVGDLEVRMKDAGDKLIWDALKLTGSQKDERLGKEELKALKDKLVEEIGAAYSLEKLRQLLKERVGLGQ